MTAAIMDREDIKTEWAKPNANPLEGMTQQDINKLLTYRSELLARLSEHYVAFTKAIFELPIHVVFRQHAFFNLDQAEMWAKKGVDNVWDLPEKEESVTAVLSCGAPPSCDDDIQVSASNEQLGLPA